MGRMYILKVECWTSPKPCGKDFTDEARCNYFRICTSSEFQIRVGPIHGQNVGSMVASRSKTSKQNLTVEVATAVSEAVSSVSSVGPVSETVGPVATVVATKAVSVSVVGISLGLSLPLAVVESVAVSKTVSPVATVVATKAVSVAVVGIGVSLRLSSGEGRKGKCQDSLHLSSATFCDKPSH